MITFKAFSCPKCSRPVIWYRGFHLWLCTGCFCAFSSHGGYMYPVISADSHGNIDIDASCKFIPAFEVFKNA